MDREFFAHCNMGARSQYAYWQMSKSWKTLIAAVMGKSRKRSDRGIAVKKVAVVALAALFFLVQGPQVQADGLYVSLNGGANFPEKTDSVFDPGMPGQGTIVTDGETGFRFGGALGYAFNRYFSVEGEFSYMENDIDTLESNLLPGGPLPAAGTARTYTGMANAYLSLPTGAWRPYVGAGIGRARVKSDGVGFAVPNPFALTDRTNDSDTALAWQLMGGVGYQIAPNLELGTRYRYLNIDDTRLVSDAGDVQAIDNIKTHSVEVVLTWSWQREERVLPPLK